MSNMNIAEKRRPQDGQYTVNVDGKNIDIRVACAGTVYGEMAVLRILRKSASLLELTDLGFFPDILERFQQLIKLPFGMILLGGPTGSGKTTTLYASLNQLNSKERNIMTIEDPVEYHLPGINQFQVHRGAGFEFSTALRSLLRQDPDIIMVGEIRDQATANIAVQAALTGHLVLSSVHANDTVSTVIRMIDLGLEPFLITSAVIGVVAQRMVRRVCPYCSQPTEVSHEEREAYEKELREERSEFTVGTGCNFCAGTGYLGRTGIFEGMLVKVNIRRMIGKGAGSDEIRAQADEEGMASLWHDGMLKVKAGVTTPYEVLRNVSSIG